MLKKKIVINSIPVRLAMLTNQTTKRNAFDFAMDDGWRKAPNTPHRW
jgi:hypothetical protein